MTEHRTPLASTFALLLAAAACSSDVDTNGTGGTGTGGAGGASSSAVTTGSTTSATTGSTTATTSTGGGTVCEQGCAKIEMCVGFDGCGALNITCPDPMYDCFLGCAVDGTCADIVAFANGNTNTPLGACINDCQGGGAGGGDQGCLQCLGNTNCFQPCMKNPNCQGWGQCALACSDPQCYADCNAAHPDAASAYTMIYECACATCDTQCAPTMDPCNQTGAGGGGVGGAGGGM